MKCADPIVAKKVKKILLSSAATALPSLPVAYVLRDVFSTSQGTTYAPWVTLAYGLSLAVAVEEVLFSLGKKTKLAKAGDPALLAKAERKFGASAAVALVISASAFLIKPMSVDVNLAVSGKIQEASSNIKLAQTQMALATDPRKKSDAFKTIIDIEDQMFIFEASVTDPNIKEEANKIIKEVDQVIKDTRGKLAPGVLPISAQATLAHGRSAVLSRAGQSPRQRQRSDPQP